MAAIIAQMTRANRERKKNKCFEIVIGKCMYEIGPFPEKYEPEVCYIDSKSIIIHLPRYKKEGYIINFCKLQSLFFTCFIRSVLWKRNFKPR